MGRLLAAAKRGIYTHATRIVGLWLALLLCAGQSYAQQAPPDDGPHYTLHAYSNLVDIPTLVLSQSGDPLPPIDAAKFGIRLDDGPRFHPSYVRREADDPISLAVLIDLSGSENDLLPALSKAVHGWAAGSLHPADRVSLYAIDCHIIRTLDNAPADPDVLQRAVDAAIHDTGIHGKKDHSACANSLHLWDALAFIAHDLAQAGGRRVILAISDGYNSGGDISYANLRAEAIVESVAIFSLSLPTPQPGNLPLEPYTTSGLLELSSSTADSLPALCALSGGLSLPTQSYNLAAKMRNVVSLLRGRYILEFPRPSKATAGFHSIDVAIEHQKAMIRPAGISVPMPNATLQGAPDVVPHDDSKDPQIGKHRTPSNL